MDHFSKCLSRAKKVEAFLATKLQQLHNAPVELAPNMQFFDYDLKVLTANPITYEVKEDISSFTTGNVFIEYESRRQTIWNSYDKG